MSTNPAFSDALARAKEIAARLTGKAAPVNHLEKKRSIDGEEMDESQSKRLNLSDSQAFMPTATLSPMPMSTQTYAQTQAQAQTQALFAPTHGYASAQVAPRSLKTTVELTIASSKVGLVIGTRGETLKRMERVTDTKITFEQPSAASNETNERKVYIVGVPEDCEAAKRLILEKAEEHFSQSGPSRSFGTGPSAPRDAFGNPLPSVHFTIPNGKVGLCIGRGGETIRELQDRSGAKIFISPDSSSSPDPNERLITVSGSEESINTAKMLIEEVLESGGIRVLQEKGMLGSQAGGGSGDSRMNVTLTVPDQMVGMLIGKKGENFRAMVSSSRAKIVIDPPTSTGTPMRYIYISGAPECVVVAQRLIHEKLSGTARLDGTTYVPITDPNMAVAGAAGYAADPYAYYYGPQYAAQYQAYYADPNQTAASPTGSAPTDAVALTAQDAASSVPVETLKQYYEYYYQYYVQAGCDSMTAAQAAQSALVAAGMPAYTGEASTFKEQENGRDQEQEREPQQQQQQQQQQDQEHEQEQEQQQDQEHEQDQDQEQQQEQQQEHEQEQQQEHEQDSSEPGPVSHSPENGHAVKEEEEN